MVENFFLENNPEIRSYIILDGDWITDDGDLIKWNYKYISDSATSGFPASAIEVEIFTGSQQNLADKAVEIHVGSTFEGETTYIPLGKFIITEEGQSFDKLTGISKFTALDYAIKADKTFDDSIIEYPITIRDYMTEVYAQAGLEFEVSAKSNVDSIVLNQSPNKDPRASCREIINHYSMARVQQFRINRDGVLTDDLPDTVTIDLDDYFDLEIEEGHTPITTLVLSREPQEDNVYHDLVETTDRTEYRITNNMFLDLDREGLIEQVSTNISGLNITPFKITLLSRPDLDPGDFLLVTDLAGSNHTLKIQNIEHEFNGGLTTNVSCDPLIETQTNYLIAGTKERINRTEIITDKANQEIKSIIEKQDEQSDELTQLTQTVDDFQFLVKKSGGANLMTNSVGFKGITDRWSIRSGLPEHIKTDAGNTWILGNSISKHGFVFSGDVDLHYDLTDLLIIGREYSFVFTLNKPLGTTFVYSINEDGAYAHGSPYSLSPTENYDGKLTINFVATGEEYVIAFESSDYAVITDIGIYEGSNAMGWQQASGEMHTLDVQIDKEGIKVYSDESRTSWTIMSPNEFAKYYGNESVFSLNEDITNVMGLQVNGKGLYTPPIKFVQNLNVSPISLDIVWTGRGDN